MLGRGDRRYSEKICPDALLSTTNPTWPDLGRRGGKPATNRQSHNTALVLVLFWILSNSL
jgi:hypothetical protein